MKRYRHPSVLALLSSTPDARSAEEAIRLRARALIGEVQTIAAWEGPPFDLDAIASFQGFRVETSTRFSPSQDACIVPGRISVNARKPVLRRRYSLAHEIAHTLFPDYLELLRSAGTLWRDERPAVQEDGAEAELEYLCQAGASELLMPAFAFAPQVAASGLSLNTVLALSALFKASHEAAARRVIEVTTEHAVAVFVQPWDRTTLQFTRDYDPRAELRITRTYMSASCAHWRLPPDGAVPPSSAVYRAWKRASYRKLGVDLHITCEPWTDLSTGNAVVDVLECHAMVMPHRSASPGEVLGLLRLS